MAGHEKGITWFIISQALILYIGMFSWDLSSIGAQDISAKNSVFPSVGLRRPAKETGPHPILLLGLFDRTQAQNPNLG